MYAEMNVHWSEIRRGDYLVVNPKMMTRVLYVSLHGAIWDENGDSWSPRNSKGMCMILRASPRGYIPVQPFPGSNKKIVVQDRTSL